ncbi:Mce-associated membrane protein [Mycobacterium sp. MAA66]|uniref:hypothetical protein n=1 Tax=Mycobacterium sp. MAA66 TaxID=3156297 RepID=UPI003512D396
MDTHSPEDSASADAPSLAADEAEAEAAEAEALAAAARAKATAIRLRREAEELQAAQSARAESSDTPPNPDPLELETSVTEPSKTPVWAIIAATLIVVLSLGLVGFGGWVMWQHHQLQTGQAAEQHRRAEFAAAAAQGVVNLMSLDYRHAQQDVQRILDGTTGDFKKDFQATAQDFVKVAESSKSVTEATVTATAVQAMTQDTATVLVAATTKVTNAASKDQQPRSWRWSVDVARDGGQIKLAKVEFVP